MARSVSRSDTCVNPESGVSADSADLCVSVRYGFSSMSSVSAHLVRERSSRSDTARSPQTSSTKHGSSTDAASLSDAFGSSGLQ